MGVISRVKSGVKSGVSQAKTTISHVAEAVTPSVAKPALQKIESKVESTYDKVESKVEEHPMAATAALAFINPVAAVGVLASEHPDEIKSTLSVVAKEVKKDAEIVKTDTIAVTKEVGHDVEKVGKTAVSGMKNLYLYGMLALGGVILIKFL